ncbi:MAG: hypothetical protein WC333_00290 [Dehalococcoidia bacterium]|jgi:hypothetical protein
MKKFTHGIVIIKQSDVIKGASENGKGIPVIQFVGYWSEPTVDEYTALREEIETDESLGLKDIANQVVFIPASQEVVDRYNTVMEIEENDVLFAAKIMKTPIGELLNFICDQELESYEDLPKLTEAVRNKFNVKNSKDEEATEELINSIIEWEKDSSIYTSLEKTLYNKFTIMMK